MTIIREINGILNVFELTFRELLEAYYEQQARFDYGDMENYITSRYEDDPDSFTEIYGIELSEALKGENLEAMAAYMRRNIDRYEVSWESAMGDALSDWASDFRNTSTTINLRKEG